MPRKQQNRLEAKDYRARLLELEQMGIPIGCADDLPPETDRFTLEQTGHDCSRIYQLPSGTCAVVVSAKMIVAVSGLLITDVEIAIPWDDFPLELSHPTESLYYKDLIAALPYSQTTVLNPLLTSELPLRRRNAEGVIVAEGTTAFPAELHDETPVTVELLLRDEGRSEFCFDFSVRVDRSLLRRYEQLQRERRERTPLTKPGLYEGGPLGDHKSVSREETIKPRHARHEYDGEPLEPKLGDQ